MQREITVIVAGDEVDALSDALLEAGALSVSVEDADADGIDEAPLYGEPGLEPVRQGWSSNRLVFLIDADGDSAQILATAAIALGRHAPPIAAIRTIDDTDWVRLTQSQFPSTRISDRLWVVPTWHEPTDPAAINIRLDPGVAFGTGTHPTTRLCLRWLAKADLTNASVLDYGCGSGILAIAALKLGARQADGTDIDVQALKAAQQNSVRNGVRARFVTPDHLAARTYDLVLANILANPLKVLAPALLARLSAGGRIVLSGILDRQAQDMTDFYRRQCPDLDLSVWGSDDGWSCIVGKR